MRTIVSKYIYILILTFSIQLSLSVQLLLIYNSEWLGTDHLLTSLKIKSDIHHFFSLCRLHGDEIRGRDAADVRSVLHSPVVWWRQTVLVRLLRVRQDHAQGEDAVPSEIFLPGRGALLP